MVWIELDRLVPTSLLFMLSRFVTECFVERNPLSLFSSSFMLMAETETKKVEMSGVNGVGEENREEKEEELLEGVAVLDFDVLCATVALQAQGGFHSGGNWGKLGDGGGDYGGGVQRMWEGELLGCFEDGPIALQTACCPCYRFGKNMQRAGMGSCLIQGTVYFILGVTALFNYIAFAITEQHNFMYFGVAFTFLSGIYLGFFRGQIRKQFNIGGNNNFLDDFVNHLICPCCTLCQESRTLEMNNVQNGVWRGRGDTICIGSHGKGSKGFLELCQPPLAPTKSPDLCSMQRLSDSNDHSWSLDVNHSVPLVVPSQS